MNKLTPFYMVGCLLCAQFSIAQTTEPKTDVKSDKFSLSSSIAAPSAQPATLDNNDAITAYYESALKDDSADSDTQKTSPKKVSAKSSKTSKTTVSTLVSETKNLTNVIQTGVASWYGKPFHGRKTASGTIFNMFNMTAASRTIPLNTRVKVTNTKNNRSIEVLVNDRGPYISGRVMDLSYAAAQHLGISGLGHIKIERIN